MMLEIAIEADAEWDSSSDWAELARAAAEAAIAESAFPQLAQSERAGRAVGPAHRRRGGARAQRRHGAARTSRPTSCPSRWPKPMSWTAPSDGPELMLGDIVLAHGVCAPRRRKRPSRRRPCRASDGPRHAASARLRPSRGRRAPRTWKRARSARWPGSGSPTPMQVRQLMATPQRRRRIAAVARNARADLRRRQRADAARPDRGSDRRGRGRAPGRRRPHAARAADAAQPAPFRRAHRRRHLRPPRRHHRGAGDDQLRGAGRRLRRRRPQPPAGLWRKPRRRHRHDPHQGRVHGQRRREPRPHDRRR